MADDVPPSPITLSPPFRPLDSADPGYVQTWRKALKEVVLQMEREGIGRVELDKSGGNVVFRAYHDESSRFRKPVREEDV